VQLWAWRAPSHLLASPGKPGVADDGQGLAYSPDGRLLAVRFGTSSDGRVVRIWDTRTGQVVRDLTSTDTDRSAGFAAGLAFSPDGHWLLRTVYRYESRAGDGLLAYRTDDWQPAWSLRTFPFQPRLVAVSPDGRLAALGGETWPYLQAARPTLLIVDLAAHSVVRTIAAVFPDDNEVNSLAWSPDGSRIAVGCTINGSYRGPDALKVFDAASGRLLAAVTARSAAVSGLAYSANGRYLVAGSIDGAVDIFDARTLRLLQRIRADSSALALSRDSANLAIAAYPTVSVWQLN
jgi:WD40 repeat protein